MEETQELDNINLIRPKFEKKYLQGEKPELEKGKVLPIRFSDIEIKEIKQAQMMFQENQFSTMVKTLMHIGYLDAIQNDKSQYFLTILKRNIKRNERVGIQDLEIKND